MAKSKTEKPRLYSCELKQVPYKMKRNERMR